LRGANPATYNARIPPTSGSRSGNSQKCHGNSAGNGGFYTGEIHTLFSSIWANFAGVKRAAGGRNEETTLFRRGFYDKQAIMNRMLPSEGSAEIKRRIAKQGGGRIIMGNYPGKIDILRWLPPLLTVEGLRRSNY